jgi:K+-transporting ATPase ATPase C chain
MNKHDTFATDHGHGPSGTRRKGLVAELLTQLRIAIVATVVLGMICCAIYPAIVLGLAQALFHHKANGSLIRKDGTATTVDSEAVGSALLGQSFADARYFHPRPSAAGAGYDPTATGGSNLGPTSAKLLNGVVAPATQPSQPGTVAYDGIKLRTLLYAQENEIDIAEASRSLKSFQDDKGNYDPVKLITAFNDADHPLTFRTARPIPPDAVTASSSGLDPHITVENANIQARRVAKARKMSESEVRRLIDQNTEGPDLGILGDAGVNVLKLNLALNKAVP